MKRLRTDEPLKDSNSGYSLSATTTTTVGGGNASVSGGGGGGALIYHQSLLPNAGATSVLAYSNASAASTTDVATIKVISEGIQSVAAVAAGAMYATPTVSSVNYGGIPALPPPQPITVTTTATVAAIAPIPIATTNNNKTQASIQCLVAAASSGGVTQLRPLGGSSPPNNGVDASGNSVPLQDVREGVPQQAIAIVAPMTQSVPAAALQQQPQQQQSPGGGSNFQRLKVEDALSYLDLVKFKFGSKPQVYNDFLDIMKEFKSQSIDTPGVIQRVSNLFKGFPELISGFNTFLPPGYKIEVQRSDQGYAFQVSVSMTSPGSTQSTDPSSSKSAMIMRGSGTINMSAAGGGAMNSVLPSSAVAVSAAAHQAAAVGPLPQSHIMDGAMAAATTNPPSVVQLPPPPPPNVQNASLVPITTPSPTASVLHHTSSSATFVGGLNSGNSGGGGGATTAFNNTLTTLSAAQVAAGHALQGHTDGTQNQPVQFNHAINYVNKIKNRFQDQPEKYKRFLDILHIYQKDQRIMKDPSAVVANKHQTEQEVYSQVAKLFENQSDLLTEFGQFLPDATSHINQTVSSPVEHVVTAIKKSTNKQHFAREMLIDRQISHKAGHISSQVKRSPPYSTLLRDGPLVKKHKSAAASTTTSCRDVTLAEAGKYGTLNDYAFFDKVRKAVRTQDVYYNFLRCLTLFNQEIISKSELLMIVTPFLGRFPELMRWFREFIGQHESGSGTFSGSGIVHGGTTTTSTCTSSITNNNNTNNNQNSNTNASITNIYGGIGGGVVDAPAPYHHLQRSERSTAHHEHLLAAAEIDLATAKRLGASYCAIQPIQQEGQTCSGRTALCKQVLNDQWVSFPTWSEDSTFVSSRKTQYEEYMYRCEDERFELDVVIETNSSTVRVLEGVQKKLNRMSADDASCYRLDDCMGGVSPSLHQRALRRIYGEKAQDIIDGLKRNPAVAVPVVLRRLKAKEEEWREAQKGFNKIWREQNEKYYLKSLDHQGINFKQTDVKALRSKSLFNEIEQIFDERHEQQEAAGGAGEVCTSGPHLVLLYKDRSMLDDAANLLIHHVKRQTGIQKSEKRRIKHLLRQFVPELFFHPKQQLTDDERDDEDDERSSRSNSPNPKKHEDSPSGGSNSGNKPASPMNQDTGGGESVVVDPKVEPDIKDDDKSTVNCQSVDPIDSYTLFITNNNWYIFLRLHAILCDRLSKIYERSVALAAEEAHYRNGRKESTAVALRLKPKPHFEVEDYYVAFLDMVKSLLDGNMDANTYEDTLREMFGIHAYVAFTLDKVVSYAVRQLQYCVTERSATACYDLFVKEQKRGATGGATATAAKRAHLEFAYQRAAEKAVQDDNCFKVYLFRKDCRLTIELLDTDTEDTTSGGKKVTDAHSWSAYKERFTNCIASSSVDGKPRSPVYLNRNLKSYKQRMCSTNSSSEQMLTLTTAQQQKDSTTTGSTTTSGGGISDSGASTEKKSSRKSNLATKKILTATTNHEEDIEEGESGCNEKTEGSSSSSSSTSSSSSSTSSNGGGAGGSRHSSSDNTNINNSNRDNNDGTKKNCIEGGVDEELNNENNEDHHHQQHNSRLQQQSERNVTDHPNYTVSDETECKFQPADSKMVFSMNKDTQFYRLSALSRAKKLHPVVTKRLSTRFYCWLKRWLSEHVSDVQEKACSDWLMGHGEGVVPNRTRVLTNNDVTKTPYLPYNRYRVERLLIINET